MKISYDPAVDAMFIYVSKSRKSTRTEKVSDDVLLDFDGKELVGIEILDVSDKLSKKNINKIMELLRPGKSPNSATINVG